MRETVNSFVRLSAAMTVFSMQQMQSVIGMMEGNEAMDKMKRAMDAMTNALTAQIDEDKRSAVDNMAKAANDVVDRTWNAVDAREILDSTRDMIRKAGDTISNTVSKVRPKTSSAAEPIPAEEVLA